MNREQAAKQFVADVVVDPEYRQHSDSVAGHPNGLVLVTASRDEVSRIWQVKSMFYESIRNVSAYCRALSWPRCSLGQLLHEQNLTLADITFHPIAARYLDSEIRLIAAQSLTTRVSEASR